MKVVWLPKALQNLKDIKEYIDKESPKSAKMTIHHIRRKTILKIMDTDNQVRKQVNQNKRKTRNPQADISKNGRSLILMILRRMIHMRYLDAIETIAKILSKKHTRS